MFSIIIKETKEFLRDKTSLFFYIMFPVILIFLLGSLLSATDKAEEAIGDEQGRAPRAAGTFSVSLLSLLCSFVLVS